MAGQLPAPVIFVPGIKGSSLRDEYPVEPEIVWSVARAVLKEFERITLHPYNTKYEANEPARVVHDQVFALFYSEFIEELRHNLTMDPDKPVPVFPFAYDWRQPLDAVQKRFADFIEEVIDRTSLLRHYNEDGYNKTTGKVNLAGHSMGCLVIAGHIKTAGLERIHRVTTIAGPFRGSLEAVAATTTGASTLSAGSTREREAARITPSLYHLLPTFAGSVKNGSPADLFDSGKWQTSILDTLKVFIDKNQLPNEQPLNENKLLSALLAEAARHRDTIEHLELPNPKMWLCIAGIDADTRVDMSIDPGDRGPMFNVSDEVNNYRRGETSNPVSVQTGDGTVPYLGSQSHFIPRNQIVCVTPGDYAFFEIKDRALNGVGLHANLPNMNLVQRLVSTHFLERKQGTLGGRPGPDVSDDDWDPPISKDWLTA
jgi:pimeloyl-ACP methyl ester carboxylesterase